jgi:hypothetical protein
VQSCLLLNVSYHIARLKVLVVLVRTVECLLIILYIHVPKRFSLFFYKCYETCNSSHAFAVFYDLHIYRDIMCNSDVLPFTVIMNTMQWDICLLYLAPITTF